MFLIWSNTEIPEMAIKWSPKVHKIAGWLPPPPPGDGMLRLTLRQGQDWHKQGSKKKASVLKFSKSPSSGENSSGMKRRKKILRGFQKKGPKKNMREKYIVRCQGRKQIGRGPREPPLGPEGGVQTLPLAPMAWVAWGGGGQTFPCAKTTPHCGLSAPPMGK